MKVGRFFVLVLKNSCGEKVSTQGLEKKNRTYTMPLASSFKSWHFGGKENSGLCMETLWP